MRQMRIRIDSFDESCMMLAILRKFLGIKINHAARYESDVHQKEVVSRELRNSWALGCPPGRM